MRRLNVFLIFTILVWFCAILVYIFEQLTDGLGILSSISLLVIAPFTTVPFILLGMVRAYRQRDRFSFYFGTLLLACMAIGAIGLFTGWFH